MKWNNLKSHKCPKCNLELEETSDGQSLKCTKNNCKFFITKKRMNDLFDKMDEDKYRKDMPSYGFKY